MMSLSQQAKKKAILGMLWPNRPWVLVPLSKTHQKNPRNKWEQIICAGKNLIFPSVSFLHAPVWDTVLWAELELKELKKVRKNIPDFQWNRFIQTQTSLYLRKIIYVELLLLHQISSLPYYLGLLTGMIHIVFLTISPNFSEFRSATYCNFIFFFIGDKRLAGIP